MNFEDARRALEAGGYSIEDQTDGTLFWRRPEPPLSFVAAVFCDNRLSMLTVTYPPRYQNFISLSEKFKLLHGAPFLADPFTRIHDLGDTLGLRLYFADKGGEVYTTEYLRFPNKDQVAVIYQARVVA